MKGLFLMVCCRVGIGEGFVLNDVLQGRDQ